MRKGIIAAGNWIADTIKFIHTYPASGNLVTIERTEMGFGGCAHNVLADLARLKTDIPLYAGGCIGNDALGDELIQTINNMGINGSALCRVEAATSYTDVMADMTSGTRTFFHHRGANATFGPEHVEPITAPARIFHLGYLLLLDKMDEEDAEYGVVAARVLKSLQERGYHTSVDVVSEQGDRFRRIVLPCLPYIDYLILNEVEAGACCAMNLRDEQGKILLPEIEKAARYLMENGVGKACVIHFPEGGLGIMQDDKSVFVPSFHVPAKEIISSVGAGDAFCATILYALHEEIPMKQSIRMANAAAWFNLHSATSTAGAPSLEELNRFLLNHK